MPFTNVAAIPRYYGPAIVLDLIPVIQRRWPTLELEDVSTGQGYVIQSREPNIPHPLLCLVRGFVMGFCEARGVSASTVV